MYDDMGIVNFKGQNLDLAINLFKLELVIGYLIDSSMSFCAG